MSFSDGSGTAGGKKSKLDGALPVSAGFWDQFLREWGVAKHIGSIYSLFYFCMKIRDMAETLLTYTDISVDTEEQEEEVVEHIEKIEPLIKWFDEWMYRCIVVPSEQQGRIVPREIGFYHLRRQNVMPIGFEMRVILDGFSVPISNEDYSEMRSYALYGGWEEGKKQGGVKNICNILEAHFHHIMKVKSGGLLGFEEETLNIGDEEAHKDLEKVKTSLDEDKVQAEIKRLQQVGDDLVGSQDTE